MNWPLPPVLVVDDEMKIREILDAFLTQMGFTVVQAPGGQEAIECLQADAQIDLVILDMKMPMVTGLQVLRQKNDLKDTRPVILLTGTVSQDNISADLQAVGYSLEDVTYKPFDLFAVLRMVRRKLNMKGEI